MEVIAGIILIGAVLRLAFTAGRDRGRLEGYSFGTETVLSHFLVSDKVDRLTLSDEDLDRLRDGEDLG